MQCTLRSAQFARTSCVAPDEVVGGIRIDRDGEVVAKRVAHSAHTIDVGAQAAADLELERPQALGRRAAQASHTGQQAL